MDILILKPFKFTMVRQVTEGARVRLTKADICMNSKSEFHQPGTVRIVAVRGNLNDEQGGSSHWMEEVEGLEAGGGATTVQEGGD